MHLPRVDRPVVDLAPGVEASDLRPGSGKQVLVVEDEPRVLALTARMLRGAGFDVLEATEGEAALKLLEQRQLTVDVLVTDVVMPRLSGIELAQRARQNRPLLPVVLCSGYAPDAEGITDDDTVFLAKPFTAAELTATVSAVAG